VSFATKRCCGHPPLDNRGRRVRRSRHALHCPWRQPAADFQKSFARAGHAHTGVFVVFALVAQILADAADLDGVTDLLARDGIWAAAILFPAGFFLSSAGRGATTPNRLIVLL
jgi:hypothetical protein